MQTLPFLSVVIPASGVGKRMASNIPKQYLPLLGKTVLEHTISKFSALPFVNEIIVVISKEDDYFQDLNIAQHNKIRTVIGGKERANSVLNGLKAISKNDSQWVMVHDAARPCVTEKDIIHLYQQCIVENRAGILASVVRDTMKRSEPETNNIGQTVDRNNLWHALTPQCCQLNTLSQALELQLDEQGNINSAVTDEASALELSQVPVMLISGSANNIKITTPDDLALAEFYLLREKE